MKVQVSYVPEVLCCSSGITLPSAGTMLQQRHDFTFSFIKSLCAELIISHFCAYLYSGMHMTLTG
jgi:hypothetical protein